ncbi:hypothetical protein INT47_001301 [Mucor saturninus]|uniref:PiggyBac transposable element-derived protein domain-containing protein n=1 Tax=Mucor saturninus TaxID=64648 RepID=A0A8H7USY0_9FUNG|nr:hypothetical protein INT47_001301 [Mucor saturninus]
MEYDRFISVLQYHVFEVPCGNRLASDPLYQIRMYLQKFNEVLARALEPGRYLCVDESMNQWLGEGMPNLKKVPRKPHPIGQEYKTLADHDTFCIIQLDTVSNSVKKKYDDTDCNLIATLKRLTEPCFFSGRTVIGDSWFGSPEMTYVLLDHGLFSIMQVVKRKYWPRGMPSNDVICFLGAERGSHYTAVKQDEHGRPILIRSYIDRSGQQRELRRPQVIDDYEEHKSSVDTNNNRRDNMISFHDIMKTYRWENRFLAFAFGIAEANAFSCFKIWGSNSGNDLLHSDFKSRLAFSLLEKVRSMSGAASEIPMESMTTRKRDSASAHEYISLSFKGKRIRQVCKSCVGLGLKNPPRVEFRCACDTKAMCKKCHYEHFGEEYKKRSRI